MKDLKKFQLKISTSDTLGSSLTSLTTNLNTIAKKAQVATAKALTHKILKAKSKTSTHVQTDDVGSLSLNYKIAKDKIEK